MLPAMPQTASAKKALRASARRRAANDRWRAALRALRVTFARRVTERNLEEARATYHKLQSTIDRMARRHILHQNTAARITSRTAAALRRLGTPPTV